MSQFLKPLTIEEAIQMKSEYPGSMYLGGGTRINHPSSPIYPDVFISLEQLNLKACVKGRRNTILGGSTSFQELMDWEDCYPPLKEAAAFISSRNIRNQATLGGNLGAGVKDSCLVPVLLVLDAELELGNKEIITLEKYIAEKRDNLILNIRFPHNKGYCAVKNVTRSSGGLSVLSAAVSLQWQKGKITRAAIAVSGTGEGVSRLPLLEKALASGSPVTEKALKDAVDRELEFHDDIKGSSEYKSYLCGIIISELVTRCQEAC